MGVEAMVLVEEPGLSTAFRIKIMIGGFSPSVGGRAGLQTGVKRSFISEGL